MSTTRKLGLHERYSVARRYIRSEAIVTAAALLHLDVAATATGSTTGQADIEPAFHALVSHLGQRIDAALSQYPLLAHCVRSPRSRSPTWTPIVPTPTSKDILHVGPKISPPDGTDVGDTRKLFSKVLLEQQNALLTSTDQERGPLWRVQLNLVDWSPGQARPSCVVVLATDHVINDGRGTLNLLQILLQCTQPASAPPAPIPPASDEIFDFKPSTGYMLGVVWQELVLPKLPLPRKIKSKLQAPISWPAAPFPGRGKAKYDIARQPKDCDPVLDLILVSAPNLITNLKRLAQNHVDPRSKTKKAATLHAVIHSLALASLFAAIAHSHIQKDETALDKFSLVLGTGTPISLRNEAFTAQHAKKRAYSLSPAVESASASPALPATSGNFVSSYAGSYRIHAGDTFWRLTNRFASELSSPKGRKLAKQHMGMLSYIPDFDLSEKNKQEAEASDKEKHMYANGWEKFFGDKVNSLTPFDSAFNISNLGAIDVGQLGVVCTEGRQWKVGAVTWAQAQTPQGEAFSIDVVGVSGTQASDQLLSISVSSRPHAFTDTALHNRFYTYLNQLLVAFASLPTSNPQSTLHLDLTIDPSFATLARFLAQSNQINMDTDTKSHSH